MDENEAAGELLEDCWFFGNLLQTKSNSRMLRSFSDPCSSSNFPAKSYEEAYETINKGKTKSHRKTASSKKSSGGSLVRAPSLPTTLETDDFHDDEEVEFSMGKLIRQASLNYSDTRPPRQIASKNLTASPSLTRQRSRLKPEAAEESLEIEELQGRFKDLGLIDVEKKDLIVQERRRMEEYEERRAPPPVPRWGGKRAPEDMKAQIKFWARAVASNVRQEC
ncbi:uncharacterized protein LOC131012434 [Salvia miltiorrhiza]|uniref:uncharacterized protein LOC131012434 n=1 Tax=Salvia miltiorrhiza TaxID=226208 RepID=UPI0025AC8E23|nr:uncharacterized protein LOC131012434 [Salvia miltiorrhiza]